MRGGGEKRTDLGCTGGGGSYETDRIQSQLGLCGKPDEKRGAGVRAGLETQGRGTNLKRAVKETGVTLVAGAGAAPSRTTSLDFSS